MKAPAAGNITELQPSGQSSWSRLLIIEFLHGIMQNIVGKQNFRHSRFFSNRLLTLRMRNMYLLNLLRKFSGRSQNQGLAVTKTEVNCLQNGDTEGRSFASARLRLSNYVMTYKRKCYSHVPGKPDLKNRSSIELCQPFNAAIDDVTRSHKSRSETHLWRKEL